MTQLAVRCALENVKVLYQDDRDAKHPDRWRIYRYRINGGNLEILMKGEWCPAILGTKKFGGTWKNDPLNDFTEYGYTYSYYGFLSKTPRSPEFGFSFNPRFAANFDFLELENYGAACAVLGLNWPVAKDDVKQAYRTLAKQHHPDAGGDREEFEAIQDAYKLLSEHI